ncbi:MAG: AMP-binding protein [Bdellovibrionota bacterium]|nr:MAG: AMP-binding protein [Bdellovibrionota bacterium]
MKYSAHMDAFASEALPPKELWPHLIHIDGVYPDRLNCATELLDRMVSSGYAKRPLLHTPSGIWSYEDLLVKANRIAHVLVKDCALLPGQRVLLRGANSAWLAACWFGVLKAGGVCVTTMPMLRSRELEYIIAKAKVNLALCAYSCVDELIHAQAASPDLKRTLVYGRPAPEAGDLDALINKHSDAFDNVETASDDVAIIGFTSGTTGKAKATMHFHRDILAICDAFPKHVLKPNKDDVFCGTPPLGFTFGLGGLLLFPMRIGASTLLLEKASPEELLSAMQQYKATICFTSPTFYRAMLGAVGKYNIRSLKKCVSAGETLPLPTYEAWLKATGIKLIDGIGATEMLHIFISSSEDEIRPGATGKVVPGYEAKVVDEHQNELPRGSVGLLAVRGPTGCRYLDDIERQKEYVRGGWNYTGDAYLQDQDGYFWFQARADDMIISSGYNIAGPEVENVLLSHSAVKECGVVASPDPERGHIVKAFIVLHNPTAAGPALVKELQDFVKSEIAPYKYPRAIEFVTSLPRTDTGKLQRFRLRNG